MARAATHGGGPQRRKTRAEPPRRSATERRSSTRPERSSHVSCHGPPRRARGDTDGFTCQPTTPSPPTRRPTASSSENASGLVVGPQSVEKKPVGWLTQTAPVRDSTLRVSRSTRPGGAKPSTTAWAAGSAAASSARRNASRLPLTPTRRYSPTTAFAYASWKFWSLDSIV